MKNVYCKSCIFETSKIHPPSNINSISCVIIAQICDSNILYTHVHKDIFLELWYCFYFVLLNFYKYFMFIVFVYIYNGAM